MSVRWTEVVKSSCCRVNCKCSWKKTQRENKCYHFSSHYFVNNSQHKRFFWGNPSWKTSFFVQCDCSLLFKRSFWVHVKLKLIEIFNLQHENWRLAIAGVLWILDVYDGFFYTKSKRLKAANFVKTTPSQVFKSFLEFTKSQKIFLKVSYSSPKIRFFYK